MARYFLTTAIDYVNSVPHVGTSYEKLLADVIARWKRLKGDDVFFLMGNDEHSQQVAEKATCCECSSLPIRKNTSSPLSRFQRAMTSARSFSYDVPTCGTLFT